MMNKVYIFLGLMIFTFSSFAQCAMCRTQVVNNVSAGETNVASGLNFGIMYLFTAPYLLVGLIAYFWYRSSRINERKISIRDLYRR